MKTRSLIACGCVWLFFGTHAWAGPVEEAQARDAAAKEDEAWRKRVYGDPTETKPSTPIPDKFAAIAFSTTTHTWGYSYGVGDLESAQHKAVQFCKANDAKVVIWAKNGWYCALAVGAEGSWGAKSAATAEQAKAEALEECRKFTKDCKIVACVCSSD